MDDDGGYYCQLVRFRRFPTKKQVALQSCIKNGLELADIHRNRDSNRGSVLGPSSEEAN